MDTIFEKGVTREDQEMRKLQAETYKLLIESLRVNQERGWHPFMVTTAFFAAGGAFIKLLDMLLKG